MNAPLKQGKLGLFFILASFFGLAFFLLPLAALIRRAPWNEALDSLVQPAVLEALLLSLEVSGLAVLLSLFLGFPLAWLLARTRFPGQGLVRTLLLLPMVIPPVVAGVALLGGFGRQGILGPLLADLGIHLPFTLGGAVLAATFVSAPFLILALESGLRSADTRLEETAAVLGAAPGRVLRSVTLPMIRPALFSGLALCWARALGEFGATITFAGNMPGKTQTLPLAVYQTLQSNFPGAILLSLLLLGISLLILITLRGRIFPQ